MMNILFDIVQAFLDAFLDAFRGGVDVFYGIPRFFARLSPLML